MMNMLDSTVNGRMWFCKDCGTADVIISPVASESLKVTAHEVEVEYIQLHDNAFGNSPVISMILLMMNL